MECSLVSFAAPALAAAIGATLATLFAVHVNKLEHRRRVTLELSSEFFSRDFMAQRAALAEFRRKYKADDHLLDSFAGGLWYPGRPDPFTGNTSDGLNAHQHFELVKGWVIRTAEACRSGMADTNHLAKVLANEYLWLDDLMVAVACKVQHQISNDQKKQQETPSGGDKTQEIRVPVWTRDVMLMHELITGRPKRISWFSWAEKRKFEKKGTT